MRASELVAAFTFGADLVVVALDPQIPFGDAHRGVAVGGPVRGCLRISSRSALSCGSMSGLRVGGAAPLAPGRDDQSGGRRPQRRRQIPAHPGLAVFDPLGQRHRADRSRGPG